MQEDAQLAEIRWQRRAVRRHVDRKIVFGVCKPREAEIIAEIHRHDGQAFGILVGDAHDFARVENILDLLRGAYFAIGSAHRTMHSGGRRGVHMWRAAQRARWR